MQYGALPDDCTFLYVQSPVLAPNIAVVARRAGCGSSVDQGLYVTPQRLQEICESTGSVFSCIDVRLPIERCAPWRCRSWRHVGGPGVGVDLLAVRCACARCRHVGLAGM